MIQCSPSFAWRLKIGVRERSEREPEKGSVAGTMRTVVGSSRGSQTSGVLSAGKCGSKGKPHPPAKSERFDASTFRLVDGPAVVSLIRGIAPHLHVSFFLGGGSNCPSQ